jgi:tetratricopeptide (TPR) repeat protein
MDDNTVKTGSGGSARRSLTKRTLKMIAIGVGIIVLAGGAGVTVRLLQNKQDKNKQPTVNSQSLPSAVDDAQNLRLNGDTAAAGKKIDDALNNKSTSTDEKYQLYIQKASLFSDQQNYGGAADAYAQALALKQTSAAYDAMGDAYAAADQKDKAIDAYKKAIPLVPASPVQDDDKEAIANKIRNLGGSV